MIRKYMLFYDMSSNGISLKEEHERYEKVNTFECPCPICSNLNHPSDLWKLGTTSGILITLHNLYWMTNYTAFLKHLVQCPEEFKAYARRATGEPIDSPTGRTSWEDAEGNPLTSAEIEALQNKGEKCISAPVNGSWVLNYMDFLDLVEEKGLEYAYSRFVEPTESIERWVSEFTTREDKEAEAALVMETNSRMEPVFKAAARDAIEKVNEKLKDKVVAEVVDELLATATPAKKASKPRKVDEDIPLIITNPTQDIAEWV